MSLRWAIAALGALALAFVTVPAPWPDGHADAAPGAACPANAKPANMNFTLKDLNNKDVKLSAFKGKVVLLDFWATWCGPCGIEIPWFTEFQRNYKDRGFEVLGVSMDDDGWKAINPYVAKRKINYRIVLGDDKTGDQYGGLEALPTTFVIDRAGRIAAAHVGLTDKKEFENAIEKLLEAPATGSSVSTVSTDGPDTHSSAGSHS
jgi:peroxiredoxin